MEHPDKLAVTVAAFAAAESAINSPAATERSEAFKEKFNFIKSGEKPRAMAPADKDGIQAEVMPFIVAAVMQALTESERNISHDQAEEFVQVLTSPELMKGRHSHLLIDRSEAWQVMQALPTHASAAHRGQWVGAACRKRGLNGISWAGRSRAW